MQCKINRVPPQLQLFVSEYGPHAHYHAAFPGVVESRIIFQCCRFEVVPRNPGVVQDFESTVYVVVVGCGNVGAVEIVLRYVQNVNSKLTHNA